MHRDHPVNDFASVVDADTQFIVAGPEVSVVFSSVAVNLTGEANQTTFCRNNCPSVTTSGFF